MSTAGRWRVVPVAVLATLGVLTVASACSNDDGGGDDASDGSVTAPAGGETSSTPPGSDGTSTSPTGPQAYAGRGPYPVGTLEIDAPNGPITVWYPGEPGSEAGAAPATYDMRTYLPPAEQAKVAAANDIVFTTDAFPTCRRRSPRAGRSRSVLFSHGFCGFANNRRSSPPPWPRGASSSPPPSTRPAT